MVSGLDKEDLLEQKAVALLQKENEAVLVGLDIGGQMDEYHCQKDLLASQKLLRFLDLP